MHNIKELKPNKNSRYKQTYINPTSCKKLFEGLYNQPIICRSSWEVKFIHWCENNKNVVKWGSECISIPYFNPIDKKQHIYYPDFVVNMMNGEKWVVEIKPLYLTQQPSITNGWAMREYIKNMAKWKTLKEKCEEKGYKFFVLTEKTISKL